MNRISRYFYSSLIIIAGTAVSLSAATFTVTNTNDTGVGSLRQAVLDANAAATADTIVFDASFNVPRTITLATVIQISPAANVDTLTINGPGANLLTIRSSGDATVRIFQNGANFTSADTTSITGITFTQSVGGNIVSFANLNVSNCTFINNISGVANGVAIHNAAATAVLNVNNSVFTGNSGAGGNGGAISNTGSATITDSTFSSNTIGYGGAIGNDNALSVTNCTFTNNTVTDTSATGLGGGAIYSVGGLVTITNSTFTGNAENGGSGGGGAVRNRAGTMNISGSTFANNLAARGGGAVQGGGTTNISGSTFTGNKATGLNASVSGMGSGGAISSQGAAQTTIINSFVSGNEAVNFGGGIYYQNNAGGSMNVTNSTISNNSANTNTDGGGGNGGGAGGGFYIEGSGVVTVTGSTISGNSSLNATSTFQSGNGGGIYAIGALNLDNSTVSGNFAAADFGGVQDMNPGGVADQVHISNSTIVNNRAAGGCGGFGVWDGTDQGSTRNTLIANNTSGATPKDIFGDINSVGYNFVRDPTAGFVGGTGNIIGQDPLLGPLEDNGGPTQTHAPLRNSPVVDKGNSFAATTDQRLLPRPFDFPAIASAAGGDGADIGAVEMRPTAQVSGRIATPSGLGLRSATVILTDSLGNRTTATTSSFGLYMFPNVPTGLSYTIGISSKRYRYAVRPINVNGDRINIDFVGLE